MNWRKVTAKRHCLWYMGVFLLAVTTGDGCVAPHPAPHEYQSLAGVTTDYGTLWRNAFVNQEGLERFVNSTSVFVSDGEAELYGGDLVTLLEYHGDSVFMQALLRCLPKAKWRVVEMMSFEFGITSDAPESTLAEFMRRYPRTLAVICKSLVSVGGNNPIRAESQPKTDVCEGQKK